MFSIIHRFGKHCSCHLQGECEVVERLLKPYIGQAVDGQLMMEAASTSETSVNFYQTTWSNNPEDSHLHTCCRENLKSHDSN
jgi:hypothetical protein